MGLDIIIVSCDHIGHKDLEFWRTIQPPQKGKLIPEPDGRDGFQRYFLRLLGFPNFAGFAGFAGFFRLPAG